eukprot:TRINITY_DN13411_c0_g1_i1.p2 TRINITY_DN13411_c0_g1~~TRINITY_DN13411_c0_g1_i1.p2  ORF type:complete len:137 (+),score=0.95 TRINITY_DN13411_c0_g1_i1:138-548(+)
MSGQLIIGKGGCLHIKLWLLFKDQMLHLTKNNHVCLTRVFLDMSFSAINICDNFLQSKNNTMFQKKTNNKKLWYSFTSNEFDQINIQSNSLLVNEYHNFLLLVFFQNIVLFLLCKKLSQIFIAENDMSKKTRVRHT